MAIEVPFVPGEPEQRISITLDEQQYVLRARWNTRDQAWYLDAWEADDTTPIAYGIKLVLGVLLGGSVHHPLFAGGLFLADNSGSGVDPGLLDLGNRCSLLFFTVADRVLASLPR